MSGNTQGEPTGRSRLEQLFFAATDLPVQEQERFIVRECAGDPEMAAALRQLLRAERAGADTWAPPVWDAAGLRFGPYRVTGRIGSGGMGVVYSAVRDDHEFDRKVAIKAIPISLLTEAGASALRHERQVLARLEHENIARLLDGGTTGDGIPYLVMEYVDGLPLMVFADTHKLDRGQRLRLFLAICDGVAYAHRRMVIHRDLKPSNILVVEGGRPKLLDFGIARLLDRHAEVTILAARRMTPEFASPEQLLGRRMTTASDIYSLGVLLFMLTTGQPAANAWQARRRLPGDLGDIVNMAMQVEPHRRYATVEALAQDIRRYLEGLPVAAHQSALSYRAAKFLTRHPVALTGAVALATAFSVASVLRRTEETFNPPKRSRTRA